MQTPAAIHGNGDALTAQLGGILAATGPAWFWAVPAPREVRRVALLAGTYNPPTNAHLALADSARALGCDCVAWVIAAHSVDKERLKAATLEDRVRLLAAIARRRGEGLLVTNRGLYADIAALARDALPAARLSFVIGFDKLVQIFDPRYYTNRESALAALFALADLIVSPRGDQDGDDIRAFLAQPEQRQWQHKVAVMPVSGSLDVTLSSTAIRQHALSDEAIRAAVPPEAWSFLIEEDPYGWTSDRYLKKNA